MLAGERGAPDFGAIFDAAPGAYLVLARDFTIIAANDAYLDMTMTKRDAILGLNAFEVFADKPGDAAAQGNASARASFERVIALRRRDAMPIFRHDIRRPPELGGGFEQRYWRTTNTPVLDPGGDVSCILHQSEDVTEIVRLQAEGRAQEEALREQARLVDQLRVATRDLEEERDEILRLQNERSNLAGIVEGSEDAIIAKALDGTVTSWNEAAQRMFGYAGEEILGRPVSILFPPELLGEAEDILAGLREGKGVAHYETRRRHRDGRDVFVSLSVSPIRDAQGRIVGAAKILRDVSGRKEAEERLADLQAELIHMSRWNTVGIMASAITHDLNQPLTASSNYLAALRRFLASPAPDRSRAVEIVDKASQQVQRAAEIVRRLRSFVAKGEPERQPHDLAEVAREAVELAAFAFRQGGVEASVEAAEGLPQVEVDKVQLQQVLVNLLRNAAEAMAECPTREVAIRLAAAPDEDAVLIEVADTGPGLAEEIRERLFQPFATTKSSGMGLGLSICQEIVKAHGGRLWANPNRPRGTIFAMSLPLGPVPPIAT